MTGANGFVGRHLIRSLSERGHRVVAFARTRSGLAGYEVRPFDLDREIAPGALHGIDVLVHAAFERAEGADRSATERNLRGTCALLVAARAAGVRFAFLSSLSAQPDARSEYGIQKYVLERIVAERGELVIRPGLVVGDGGLVRSLHAYVQRGIVPLIDGGSQPVYVIGMNDLSDAIAVALASDLRGAQTVCVAEPVTVRELVRTLAEREHLAPQYVSIPWAVAYRIAAAAERFGHALPLTTENLLGMRNAAIPVPSADLERLGWRASPWSELLPSLAFGGDGEAAAWRS